jgi:formate dehydrogenase major subunit
MTAPPRYGTPNGRDYRDVAVTKHGDAGPSTASAGHGAGRHLGDARRRARRHQIPKLCATDSLEAFGSCRLCLVEIEGRKGYPASCTTPAEAGMKVRTQNAARWRSCGAT